MNRSSVLRSPWDTAAGRRPAVCYTHLRHAPAAKLTSGSRTRHRSVAPGRLGPRSRWTRRTALLAALAALVAADATPSGPADLRLLVRRLPAGEVSRYLWDLPAGATVHLRGPHAGFDVVRRMGLSLGGEAAGRGEDDAGAAAKADPPIGRRELLVIA